jgi:TetR/AcrR family transcriptional regulator
LLPQSTKRNQDVKCVNQSSEEKIKEAAKSVFLKKGFTGTTARDIAEAAGMNIALTNYYFRSKEKLFLEIFRDLFTLYYENTLEILKKPISLKDKLINLIEVDYQLMKSEPNLVLFIMNEIHRDPDNILPELTHLKDVLRSHFSNEISEEVKLGRMRDIEVENLMPLILGSLQFIFICKNMQMKMNNMSEDDFNNFTESHKNHVINMITNYLFTVD